MALYPISAGATRQPRGLTRPNPEWLKKGLVFLSSASHQADLVRGLSLGPTNRVGMPTGEIGFSKAASVSGASIADGKLPSSTNEATVLTWGFTDSVFNNDGGSYSINVGSGIVLRHEPYTSGETTFYVYYYPDYSGSLTAYPAGGDGSLSTGRHVLAGRYRRNSAAQLWVDGRMRASVPAGDFPASMRAVGDTSILISSNQQRSMIVGGAALFLRALTDAELVSLAANPWQLFEAEDWLFTASGPPALVPRIVFPTQSARF